MSSYPKTRAKVVLAFGGQVQPFHGMLPFLCETVSDGRQEQFEEHQNIACYLLI